MRVGLDIGSTTIKCVVLDENNQILYATYNDGKYDIYTEVTSKNLLLYITEGKLEEYKKLINKEEQSKLDEWKKEYIS